MHCSFATDIAIALMHAKKTGAVTSGSDTVNVPSLPAPKRGGENKAGGQRGAAAHYYKSTIFASAKLMSFLDFKWFSVEVCCQSYFEKRQEACWQT